jgi:putative hydrolase of the HAD superfamily
LVTSDVWWWPGGARESSSSALRTESPSTLVPRGRRCARHGGAGSTAGCGSGPEGGEQGGAGEQGARQWRQAAAQTLTALTGEAAAKAIREWSDLPVALAADVLELLAQVGERHPVVLLTNATDRLTDDLKRLDIGHVFDAIVNTSDVGSPKPERAAFEAASDAVGRVLDASPPPATIAFVDDTRGHVMAAQSLGWRGHVYLDAVSLRDFLDECGLLKRA